MKIAVISNLNNNAYRLAKFLRKRNIQADFLITYNELYKNFNTNPILEDSYLKNGFPNWIKNWDATSNMFAIKKHLSAINILKQYDLVHAFTLSSIYPFLANVKYVANPTGSDLNELNLLRPFNMFYYFTLNKADYMIFHNLYHFDLVKSIKAKKMYLPTLIDGNNFRPTKFIRKKHDKIIFFMPSRIDFDIKGLDKAIYAFAILLKKNKKVNIELILVEHGKDLLKCKSLVDKLDIKKNISFVKPLMRSELINYYYMSDVVIEQFVLGTYSKVFLEAAFCKKPIISYVKDSYIKQAYGDDNIPFLNAFSVEEIYNKMQQVLDIDREELGNKIYNWVMKYHHWENGIDKYIKIYKKILY